MSKLTINADKIEKLVKKHGDIDQCEKSECEICEEIINLRLELGPGEKRGVKKGKNTKPKYIYTVRKKGFKKEFYRILDVAFYFNVSDSLISRIINNNSIIKGYSITKKKIEKEGK